MNRKERRTRERLMDKLEGRENKIFQQRDKKLEEAREKRSSKNTIKIAA